jgi:hypothetical protein
MGNSTQTGNAERTGETDLNGILDVEGDANFQSDVSVEDNTVLNSANNDGTVFTVNNSQGGAAVTITTQDDNQAQGGSATTLTTPKLIVQEDFTTNGDMNVSGSLGVTGNVTSSAIPSSGSHLTNKTYVDDAIADAITPPVMYSYDATNSTSIDNNGTEVTYYINGDLLLYATEETGLINYTISVYGENLDNVTGATLRARGNSNDLTDGSTAWSNTDASTSTFDIGYTDVVALAGGQTDGYVSCSLSFTTAAGTYNSGLTIRFYLDANNAAATGATFQE